ncbi:hypothetical protein BC827DRAFT_261602 [Russula dissimulans]|nr:hypothetical protein BC827DRAFT_261602 [Russula dissimulans]
MAPRGIQLLVAHPLVVCILASKLHKTPATDKPRLPLTLEGLHLSNDGIIASSSSMSETSKPPTINRNARANPMRQSRYRSQRDSINAYLRKASATTPRQPSSVPLRSVPSLLTRMTDETVANPNLTASGADTGITQVPDWDGNARLPPHMVELSSRPSVDDDPSERREEGTVTKAESESGAALPPPSHACLLHVEKATTAEARLRKQVRLRARLAAERSLARDDGGKENASTGSR